MTKQKKTGMRTIVPENAIPHSTDDVARFMKHVDRSDKSGCWPWTGSRNRWGYGTFLMRRRSVIASRVAYAIAYGKLDKRCVCHTCDNPACCNPKHLFLGTQSENVNDAFRKGRIVRPSGERHARAKLTSIQVSEIRTRLAEGEPLTSIAKAYGVVFGTIGHIKYGRNWKRSSS